MTGCAVSARLQMPAHGQPQGSTLTLWTRGLRQRRCRHRGRTPVCVLTDCDMPCVSQLLYINLKRNNYGYK